MGAAGVTAKTHNVFNGVIERAVVALHQKAHGTGNLLPGKRTDILAFDFH